MLRGQRKGTQTALVVSFIALGVAVLAMIWLTIAAVIGEFPWGTWAFALVVTGLLGLFLGRIYHRINSAASISDTDDDPSRK